MNPINPWTYALERFVVFLRDVVSPAAYSHATPLEAAVWQTREPVAYADAARARYAPVRPGFTWGPRWSTAWFRLSGRVPEEMAGRTVVVRFSTDTEALLWMPGPKRRGVPHHGLDVNRDAVRLFEPARGGERVELHVEAACNHLFGDRGLQWEGPEIHRRWNSQRPGLLERCELAVLDETVWRLRHAYAFALDLARNLPPESARARQLLGVLRRATDALPDDAVAARAPGVLKDLLAALGPPIAGAGGSATLCHSVGHAHIDTAWLWPVRETRRKLHRTFSTTLRNMERYPEYRFLCSQAQQYAWVERSSPELFEQIKRRVAQGRWEPGGGMWVEPDCTAPSGESLIRQCLYADRYWRSRFGDKRGAQRFLYLPDTFGFPAQLPQIMRHCGLDTFITNKLHWNSHTTFPHTTFVWRGLDGSEVLAHQTPGMDYNATMTPRELIRGESTHKNKDMPSASPGARRADGPARWLQPFGFGDGGGGPTDWNLEYARFAADCDGLPRVVPSTVGEFCDALHRDVEHARRADPHSVPVHDGELYLELHRGTYTTHARIKQANAECEELLRQAEILTFAGPTRLPRKQERAAKAELDRAWELLLLNQFHDILPGSSITWVYEDAAKDYAQVRSIAQRLIDEGMTRWAAACDGGGRKRPVCVFNPAGLTTRPDAEFNGRALHDVPLVFGAQVVEAQPTEPIELPVKATASSLSNGNLVSVRFDREGRVVSLRSPIESDADLCARGADGRAVPMHELRLFEDRPRLWDAWDIDEEHRNKPVPINSPVRCELLSDDPRRSSIRFSRSIGRASTAAWTYTLRASSFLLEVELEVDWREEHRLLRAEFPTALRCERVVMGTQFGARERSAARNTTGERTAFEVPFHGYLSLAAPGAGLSVVALGKYGADCRSGPLGTTVGVSLLRSPRYPDPTADAGRHVMRYALVPGQRCSGPEAFELLNAPARCVPLPRGSRGAQASWRGAPLELVEWSGFRKPRIAAIKRAEDDDRLIVRLVEEHGEASAVRLAWGFPVSRVEAVDGLERPVRDPRVRHDRAKGTRVSFRPFEIVTLAVTRAD
jgi:alpha-mannosidase